MQLLAKSLVLAISAILIPGSVLAGFLPNEDWTQGPYFGSRGTFFADVTGDGWADAIVVNDDTVTVRRGAANSSFDPNAEDWTQGPYFGTQGTFLTDEKVSSATAPTYGTHALVPHW